MKSLLGLCVAVGLLAGAATPAASAGEPGAVLSAEAAIPSKSPAPLTSAMRAKADPWVQERLAGGGTSDFLVILRDQADLAGVGKLPSKDQKGHAVVERLRAQAERSQTELLRLLARRGVPYRSFWVANMIWVEGVAGLAADLASRPEVARLAANPRVRLEEPVEKSAERALSPEGIEWNVSQIHAPDLWALGFTGQGVVIAGGDTGYNWTHPALKGHYRGWNGTVADHNYSWHDAIHTGGGSCGANALAPCDDFGHGTHTMGTMVGDDGAGNQVGVAPGARWIGCRNMDQGTGTPATYTECFQWFLAPTNLAGGSADPSKAPDAINNSWGCPPSEGCTDPTVLQTVVENVRAAGILVVVSAGNSGPSCSTVTDPASIYQASFTVGATDASDTIASFSSRGPVTVDASNRMKPDVSAPGVSIRSSLPGTGYGNLSGTSMAGPHVAATAALLFSALPALSGQVSAVETLLRQTSVPRTTTQICGGIDGSQVPNNTYGWGRIDAFAAYRGAFTDLSVSAVVSPAVGAPGVSSTWTITVSNQAGRETAAAVSLIATIPSGASAGFAVPSQGSCSLAPPTLTCSLGAIGAGASATVAVPVTPSAPGTLTLALSVTSAETDADTSNNAFTLTTPVEFTDVAPTAPFHDFVARLARAGVTAGCGNGDFCPDSFVTRAQMAVFLLRSKNGSAYNPPVATGTVFTDVPASSFAAAWIEALAASGVTTGCGGGNYCPGDSVTRAQMAVFLLRTLHGAAFVPPPATGTVFSDVPASAFAAAWIERLSAEGLTAGCGGGAYCPDATVSRAQMAVFLVQTFQLP